MRSGRRMVLSGALVPLLLLAGCSVNVKKAGDGEDKDVSIHTPFGGLQVHKNGSGAADLGLPAYPGAVPSPDKSGNDKSVDMRVGFAQWQVHVQVVNYSTADSPAKVQEFYHTALGRYGAVLTCRGDETVGTPTRTGEGLTCRDHEGGKSVNADTDAKFELKAGSERRQHIVAFEHPEQPGTHFALIALTLPAKGSGHADSEE